MTNTTVNSASVLKPEQVHDLVILPLTQQSVAFQVSTIARTDRNQYRVPQVTGDPATGWTPEGAEIAVDDLDLAEIVVTPKKVAGLTVVSNELIADAGEDAAKLIGDRLVNSLRRKIDAAYFNTATTNGPAGLPSVAASMANMFTGVAGGFGANVDPFIELTGTVEANGGGLTAWVMPPAQLTDLAQLKESSGSNKSLLQPDPTQPTRKLVNGVPVLVSPDIPAAVVWGVSKPYSIVLLRNDADIQIDSSSFFTSDRTAVRVTLRIGFAFPHPAAMAQLRLGTA